MRGIKLVLFRFEYKPDKMPIGINAVMERSFTNHVIDLQDGDMIYLFSDGYADQFGGPEDKKFKYSNLKKLLLRISQYSPEVQKKKLEQNFLHWKSDSEQVDDVLVIGIKITSSVV